MPVDSIKRAVKETLEIKKSTFIAYVRPAAFIKDIEHALREIRAAHPDAAHHCVAYVLGHDGETQKFDDDGEPAHTAGKPMLEVLRKQHLTNVLCVVVRYFGGVKLGAGGLVRAYTKATSEALKKAGRTTPVAISRLHVHVDFADSGGVERALREHGTLIDSVYTDHVQFVVDVTDDAVEMLRQILRDLTRGKALVETASNHTIYK